MVCFSFVLMRFAEGRGQRERRRKGETNEVHQPVSLVAATIVMSCQ